MGIVFPRLSLLISLLDFDSLNLSIPVISVMLFIFPDQTISFMLLMHVPVLVIWKIFRALSYIHRSIGVCHRDIKPQNLLVSSSSSTMLMP